MSTIQLRTDTPPAILPQEVPPSRIRHVVETPFRLLAQFFAYLLRPMVEYVLRVSIYRSMALGTDWVTRYCLEPTLQGVFNIWSCYRGGAMKLDPVRLLESEQFIKQFAEFDTITTSDGKRLRFALYKPEALDLWIEANGGVREGEWLRPKTPADWNKLQTLRQFHWFEEVGQAFKLPEKRADLADKCLLRIQGFGRVIPMDKAFIGAHMALGISFAIFDWHEGELTPAAMFEDAETAFRTLVERGFSPDQIIPMGSCRSNFIIGKLKEDHHSQGMSAVFVQPPPSLEGMIKKQNPIANFLGMSAIRSVEPNPGDYDPVARLNRLPHDDKGATCLIFSENDETLPEGTEEQFRTAAEKAGRIETIIQHTEEGVDAHLQEPLRDKEVFNRYICFLQSC